MAGKGGKTPGAGRKRGVPNRDSVARLQALRAEGKRSPAEWLYHCMERALTASRPRLALRQKRHRVTLAVCTSNRFARVITAFSCVCVSFAHSSTLSAVRLRDPS
jgi:hypothetical protein